MTTSRVKPSEERWRVIVIDDCAEDLAQIRRLLLQGSERRYDFTEAATGAAGLEAILEAPGGLPDCVILDYHLPDIDAAGVLAELRAGDGEVVCPIVVITGVVGRAAGLAALRAGAQEFVEKSWLTAESLTRAVENAVQRWALARALRSSELRLRLAVEASKTGIWTRDLRTEAVTWSPECHAICGFAEGTFDGTAAGFAGVVHPDDRAQVAATSSAAIETRELCTLEFRVVRPGGEVVWVQSAGRAYDDAAGRPVKLMGTLHDISARKQAEEALRAALDQARQAVRARDELVSLVSHDLKNPLHVLMMSIAVLDAKLRDESRGPLKVMARQARRMKRMIDALLDGGQLHAGIPLVLRLADTDLVALARTAVEEYQLVAPAHRITLGRAPASLVGRWDPRRIESVFDNLLSNAVKYSPHGGEVRIDLEIAREQGTTWALVRITDEGIGVAPGDRQSIFHWYSRGHNPEQATIPGTGIGLAGSRDIVEQHGGSIVLDSEEGKGSTFTVRLPVASPASSQRSSAS